MEQILPVLLGSDANVYGMARSFYMEYGVTSLAIGKGRLCRPSPPPTPAAPWCW